MEPQIDLVSLARPVVSAMDDEIRELSWRLYRTPRWRMIRRYRLFERIYKLGEDRDLIAHVLLLKDY